MSFLTQIARIDNPKPKPKKKGRFQLGYDGSLINPEDLLNFTRKIDVLEIKFCEFIDESSVGFDLQLKISGKIYWTKFSMRPSDQEYFAGSKQLMGVMGGVPGIHLVEKEYDLIVDQVMELIAEELGVTVTFNQELWVQ